MGQLAPKVFKVSNPSRVFRVSLVRLERKALKEPPSIMGLLTNDSHVVPTDSAGNNGNFNGCNTTVKILVGTSDDSANWNVTAIPTNVTGNSSGKTYTVETLSADVGICGLF